ncbi:hypothetical protein GGF37_004787, partial [Kickxella alabastrina]
MPAPAQYATTALQSQQQQMILQQNRLLAGDYAADTMSPHNYQGYTQHFAPASGPVQIWMGDIEAWMDDECIRQMWARAGELVSVKMIRDRLTGGPANYCFIEVPMQADAERLLALYNGKSMPIPFDRPFRLNWASGMTMGLGTALSPLAPGAGSSTLAASPYYLFSTIAESATGVPTPTASNLASTMPPVYNTAEGPEYSLFVGDLAPEVTDMQLIHEFRCRYASVRAAKVVTDPVTLLPRGYGFVRFGDEADQQRALVEMQGQMMGSRAIRVSTATPKRTPTMPALLQQQQQYMTDSAAAAASASAIADTRDMTRSPASSEASIDSNALYNPATDPFNTTVFVGGLVNPVSEEELHAFFSQYGEVNYCKIPPNRGCGFVTFAKRPNAETAMRALNGHMLGGSRVRLSWGRSQSHARHNHKSQHHHHHHHHHHHSQQGSNGSSGSGGGSGGGGSSGANSHRNSVSEQNGMAARRSVSLSKPSTKLAPTAMPAAVHGLGLSGASNVLMASAELADSKSAISAPLHIPTTGNPSVAQPSPGMSGGTFMGVLPYIQQQQQQQTPNAYNLTPQSAFYAVNSIHPGASNSVSTMEGLGGDSGARNTGSGNIGRGGFAGAPLPQTLNGFAYQQQQQQQNYYYSHQQDAMMLATPMTAHTPGI